MIQKQLLHLLDTQHTNTLTTVSRLLIQPTTTTLNTTKGLVMTALGMTALHLRIADFKFTHNFVIYNRLPDTEIIFRIDI